MEEEVKEKIFQELASINEKLANHNCQLENFYAKRYDWMESFVNCQLVANHRMETFIDEQRAYNERLEKSMKLYTKKEETQDQDIFTEEYIKIPRNVQDVIQIFKDLVAALEASENTNW